MNLKAVSATLIAATLTTGGIALRAQQPPAGSAQDHVAALKASVQDGLKKARQYEWVETTIISLKGEEKARKQNRCYYGADGKVQKVSLDQPSAPKASEGGGGRRGGGRLKQQVVENKKEDMQEYMQRAAALIHKYIPPSPTQIQAAKEAGHVKPNPQGGGTVQLMISSYLQAGDAVTIDLDAAANRLLGLGVKTYLDKPDEPVTLDVKMNTLPDGALYAAQTTLEAKEKNIKVVIENSGFKPVTK